MIRISCYDDAMNSALTLDRGHAAHAADGGRVRALPEADRHEPVAVIAEAAGGGDALSKLAGGWSGPPRQRSFWLVVAGVHVLGAWALSRSLGTPAVAPKPGPVQVRPDRAAPAAAGADPARDVARTPLAHGAVDPADRAARRAGDRPGSRRGGGFAAGACAGGRGSRTGGADGARHGRRQAIAAGFGALSGHARTGHAAHVPALGESGTVLLHILVDERGQLKSATVKKSSGFDRLDQQALLDIRSARFCALSGAGPAGRVGSRRRPAVRARGALETALFFVAPSA